MKVYNKLVRDRIPQIIEELGNKATVHVLTQEEYLAALDMKLNEEVAEYQKDKNLEELADILEVLQTICVARGYSIQQLEDIRMKKALERGGFKDRIYLENVE